MEGYLSVGDTQYYCELKRDQLLRHVPEAPRNGQPVDMEARPYLEDSLPVIAVADITRISDVSDDLGAFRLTLSDSKEIVLAAPSRKEKMRWVIGIRNIAEGGKDGSPCLLGPRYVRALGVCCMHVCRHGLETKGIFRLSGGAVTPLFRRLTISKQPVPVGTSPLLVAGLVKQMLMLIPETVLTNELFDDFMEAAGVEDTEMLEALVKSLHAHYRRALGCLVVCAHYVLQHSEVNRMDLNALSKVLAPCLMPKVEPSALRKINTASESRFDYLLDNLVKMHQQLFAHETKVFAAEIAKHTNAVPTSTTTGSTSETFSNASKTTATNNHSTNTANTTTTSSTATSTAQEQKVAQEPQLTSRRTRKNRGKLNLAPIAHVQPDSPSESKHSLSQLYVNALPDTSEPEPEQPVNQRQSKVRAAATTPIDEIYRSACMDYSREEVPLPQVSVDGFLVQSGQKRALPALLEEDEDDNADEKTGDNERVDDTGGDAVNENDDVGEVVGVAGQADMNQPVDTLVHQGSTVVEESSPRQRHPKPSLAVDVDSGTNNDGASAPLSPPPIMPARPIKPARPVAQPIAPATTQPTDTQPTVQPATTQPTDTQPTVQPATTQPSATQSSEFAPAVTRFDSAAELPSPRGPARRHISATAPSANTSNVAPHVIDAPQAPAARMPSQNDRFRNPLLRAWPGLASPPVYGRRMQARRDEDELVSFEDDAADSATIDLGPATQPLEADGDGSFIDLQAADGALEDTTEEIVTLSDSDDSDFHLPEPVAAEDVMESSVYASAMARARSPQVQSIGPSQPAHITTGTSQAPPPNTVPSNTVSDASAHTNVAPVAAPSTTAMTTAPVQHPPTENPIVTQSRATTSTTGTPGGTMELIPRYKLPKSTQVIPKYWDRPVSPTGSGEVFSLAARPTPKPAVNFLPPAASAAAEPVQTNDATAVSGNVEPVESVDARDNAEAVQSQPSVEDEDEVKRRVMPTSRGVPVGLSPARNARRLQNHSDSQPSQYGSTARNVGVSTNANDPQENEMLDIDSTMSIAQVLAMARAAAERKLQTTSSPALRDGTAETSKPVQVNNNVHGSIQFVKEARQKPVARTANTLRSNAEPLTQSPSDHTSSSTSNITFRSPERTRYSDADTESIPTAGLDTTTFQTPRSQSTGATKPQTNPPTTQPLHVQTTQSQPASTNDDTQFFNSLITKRRKGKGMLQVRPVGSPPHKYHQ